MYITHSFSHSTQFTTALTFWADIDIVVVFLDALPSDQVVSVELLACNASVDYALCYRSVIKALTSLQTVKASKITWPPL